MGHADIINTIIKESSYSSYLELGTGPISPGSTFYNVECENKTSVDARRGEPEVDFHMCFEEFFNIKRKELTISAGKKELPMWDFITRDCGYDYDSVKASMYLSLDFLSPNGTIICPFVDPIDSSWQRPLEHQAIIDPLKNSKFPKAEGKGMHYWCGHAWKVLVEMQYDKNIDVDIIIVRNNKSEDGFSHGLGVVRKIDKQYKDLISARNRSKKTYEDKFIDFNFYEKNKCKIMNIISYGELFKDYVNFDDHMNASYKFLE